MTPNRSDVKQIGHRVLDRICRIYKIVCPSQKPGQNSGYLINKFKNSVGLTTICPLQDFLGKCFLLPVIRTSAVDARAASRNGSSLLSGRSKDSGREGAFIPFERMTSSMVWTFFRFRSNFGLFNTSRYSASICSLIMI